MGRKGHFPSVVKRTTLNKAKRLETVGKHLTSKERDLILARPYQKSKGGKRNWTEQIFENCDQGNPSTNQYELSEGNRGPSRRESYPGSKIAGGRPKNRRPHVPGPRWTKRVDAQEQ